MSDVLNRLAEAIDERRRAAPQDSYVAGLFHAGLDKILKNKLCEIADAHPPVSGDGRASRLVLLSFPGQRTCVRVG